MKAEEEKEKKNKRIALLTSLAIHASLFLILFFLVAWRPPNPPLNLPGVEINIGFDDQGGGDVQPEEPVRTEQPTQEENTPQEQPQEEVKDASTPPEAVVSKEESPVVVKEPEKKPVIEKPKDKVAEAKPAESTKETKKDPKPDPATQVPVANKGTKAPSQGDDPGKTGDKGNPDGKPDANALYGKQGGGGGGDGFALAMSGWAWAENPKIPDLPDNEDGKIEFEIECDENGDIISVQTKDRGLSLQAEKILKEEIRKNSLIPTSGGKKPERSKGKVVFILKTR
jgi:protein TonB